jgi:hypothetical protein
LDFLKSEEAWQMAPPWGKQRNAASKKNLPEGRMIKNKYDTGRTTPLDITCTM